MPELKRENFMPTNQHYKPLGFGQYYNYHAHHHTQLPVTQTTTHKTHQWNQASEIQTLPKHYLPQFEEPAYKYEGQNAPWKSPSVNNSPAIATNPQNGNHFSGDHFGNNNNGDTDSGRCCGTTAADTTNTYNNNGKWYWLPTPNKEQETPILPSTQPQQVPAITEEHWKWIIKNNKPKMVPSKPSVESNTFEPFKAIYNHFKEKMPFAFDGMITTTIKSTTETPFSYDAGMGNDQPKEIPQTQNDHHHFISHEVHQPHEQTYITESEWTQLRAGEQEKEHNPSSEPEKEHHIKGENNGRGKR